MAMVCPNDGTVLTIADRQGVEIDFCPECRGVWLDRGELDKIIERGAKYLGSGDRDDRDDRSGRDDRRDRDDRRPFPGSSDRDRHTYGGYPKKKKHKGFLEEMFDF